jgi:hypothetical protein
MAKHSLRVGAVPSPPPSLVNGSWKINILLNLSEALCLVSMRA